jgi:hypothetical protein
MPAYTIYVSPDDGDDARTLTQAQSPDTPWKTINRATNLQAYSPGDSVTILVRTPSGTIADRLRFTTANHAGVTFAVGPETPGDRIPINPVGISTYLVSLANEFTDAAPLGITVANLDMVSAAGVSFLGASGQPSATIVIDNCTGISTEATCRWIQVGNTGNYDMNLTIRDTTFTGGRTYLYLPRAGHVILDGVTVTVGNSSTDTPTLYLGRIASLTICGHCQFTLQQSKNYGWLSWLPRECSSISIGGETDADAVVVDGTGITGSVSAMLRIDTISPTSTVTECDFSLRHTTIKCAQAAGGVVRLGVFDDSGLSRVASRAALPGIFTNVVIDDNQLVNTVSPIVATTSGLWIGQGFDNGKVRRNYICNGDLTATSGHGFRVDADGMSIEANLVYGSLTMLLFGNNNTVRRNTCFAYSTTLLFGRTGTGVWDGSQGNIVTDNIFYVASPTSYTYSDYEYNVHCYAAVPFTNRLDRNLYFAPNESPLANINSIECYSLSEIQAVWATWGTHPDNDSHTYAIDAPIQYYSGDN